MGSPTQRSLAHLRKLGWEAEVVEKFNRFAGPHGQRKDLFGFIDILAIHEDWGFLAVQTTSFGSMRARLKKIGKEPKAVSFIRAGGRIEVHGWKKGGKRSPRPGRWMCVTIQYPEV